MWAGGSQRAAYHRPHAAPGQMIALGCDAAAPTTTADRPHSEGARSRAVHGHAVVMHVTETTERKYAHLRDGIVQASRSSAFTA